MSKKVKNRKCQYCAFPMITANLHVSLFIIYTTLFDPLCM